MQHYGNKKIVFLLMRIHIISVLPFRELFLTMNVMLSYLWAVCLFWLQITVLNLSSWRESCILCVILSAGPASVWTCVMDQPMVLLLHHSYKWEKKPVPWLGCRLFFLFQNFLGHHPDVKPIISKKSTNVMFGNSLRMFFFWLDLLDLKKSCIPVTLVPLVRVWFKSTNSIPWL